MVATYDRWGRNNNGSLILSRLPTLIAAIYYFLIAADLYASEARFVVRFTFAHASHWFDELCCKVPVSVARRTMFTQSTISLSPATLSLHWMRKSTCVNLHRSEADFLARYPNLIDSEKSEDFFRYYQKSRFLLSTILQQASAR